MGYIDPPEPADDVVIWPASDSMPAFTWGDHRQMRAWLAEIEAEDAAVRASRERLDRALEECGWTVNGKVKQICEFCWRPEDQPHEVDCRDHNDPAMWVKREASAYQYLGPDFVPIHQTSVPMTDDEALEYFGIVELMFTGEGPHAVYIMRKALDSAEFKMMPFRFDCVSWEVKEIVRPAS